jgi:hypothetical protein
MNQGGGKKFMGFTNHYQDIQDMENNNSQFSKELSTLVI